jgi:hypothetical protein
VLVICLGVFSNHTVGGCKGRRGEPMIVGCSSNGRGELMIVGGSIMGRGTGEPPGSCNSCRMAGTNAVLVGGGAVSDFNHSVSCV